MTVIPRHAQSPPPLFILILYVLERLNLIKRMAREETHTLISSEVCCKPPLGLRVLFSRATAHKSPSTEVLKIRFVLETLGFIVLISVFYSFLHKTGPFIIFNP